GIGPLATVRALASTVITAELVFADRDANDKVQNAVGESRSTRRLRSSSFANPANQIGSTLQIDGITIRYDQGVRSVTGVTSTPPYEPSHRHELQLEHKCPCASGHVILRNHGLFHGAGSPYVNSDGTELTSVSAGSLTSSFEDKTENFPTYADWPKWVYWNGSTCEDLDSSLDTGSPYHGQVDMSAVTASKAIVRHAVGTVSEGTTKSVLEALTVSNLQAQMLNVGPEVGIMPIARDVSAFSAIAPVDAQIGTTHTSSAERSSFSAASTVHQRRADLHSQPAIPLLSRWQTLSVNAEGAFVIDANGDLTFGLAVASNLPSSGSGLSAKQRMYADTTSIVVTEYNRESTFLVLSSKFNNDAVLEVYDATFGWQSQTTSTWTYENITVGTANIPYTRIRIHASAAATQSATFAS
ncbi:MAG: hypothetical protein SGPRY_007743, partial [Prymnesium sp.]